MDTPVRTGAEPVWTCLGNPRRPTRGVAGVETRSYAEDQRPSGAASLSALAIRSPTGPPSSHATASRRPTVFLDCRSASLLRILTDGTPSGSSLVPMEINTMTALSLADL